MFDNIYKLGFHAVSVT